MLHFVATNDGLFLEDFDGVALVGQIDTPGEGEGGRGRRGGERGRGRER